MTNGETITLVSLAAELRAQRVLLISMLASHPDLPALRMHFSNLMSHEIEEIGDVAPLQMYSILQRYEEAIHHALKAQRSGG